MSGFEEWLNVSVIGQWSENDWRLPMENELTLGNRELLTSAKSRGRWLIEAKRPSADKSAKRRAAML